MPLSLLITICIIRCIAYAHAQVAPITNSASRAAATAPAPEETESVEIVTVKYDVGSTTFVDVKTYTDYGSVLPPDLIDANGTGVRTANLATQTDPCGPAVQTPGTPPTCNPDGDDALGNFDTINDLGYDASYVYKVAQPEPYGVQCLNSSSGTTKVNSEHCKVTVVDICRKIRSRHSPRNKWIWSSVGGADCAMAYWRPKDEGSAPAPDTIRCEYGIYGAMWDLCSGMIAAVNLLQLPGTNGTGVAVNPEYLSYIVAPEPIP